MPLDTHRIRQDFHRSSAHYTQHAGLQWDILTQLCERATPYMQPHQQWLDIGCGPGWIAEQCSQPITLIGLDIAPAMCHATAKRGIPAICADASQLPIAPASIDGILSSLCVQWLPDPNAFFAETYRTLKPGGHFAIATLGPQTLTELRASFAAQGEQARVLHFHSADTWQHMATNAGLQVLAVTSTTQIQSHQSVTHLLRSLRGIGATNKRTDRPRSLTGKGLLNRVTAHYNEHYRLPEGGVMASWQPIFLIGRKP